MTIKEEYQVLAKKEYQLALLDAVAALKARAIKEDNDEYRYKCNILMCDVYIENNDPDSALNVILTDIGQIDPSLFQNIYVAHLDRVIYLYIEKRSYHIALHYLKEKEAFLDKNDMTALNRLRLEYAYVFGELGDFTQAIFYFEKILAASPTLEMRSYVLSNLTKIYIDLKELDKAKTALAACPLIDGDHEGKVYLAYLQAKIDVLEEKYDDALTIYQRIFAHEIINKMTLGILNDYLGLTILLKRHQESAVLIAKLDPLIDRFQDLELKKDYLRHKMDYYLAISANAEVKKTADAIDKLTDLINNNARILALANFEDEKNELQNEVKTHLIQKVDDLSFLLDINLAGNSLREILGDYGFKLSKILPLSFFTFVLFNRPEEQEYEMSDSVWLFQYQSGRLYEKKLPFEQLKGTVVEATLANNKDLALDYAHSNLELKDIFTGKNYDKTTVRNLVALPCFASGDLFACAVYSAINYDFTDSYHVVLLKVATRSLESSLIIYFLKSEITRATEALQFVIDSNNIGLFYLNNDTLYLSRALKELFLWKADSMPLSEFTKRIRPADLDSYLATLKSDLFSTVKYRFNLIDKNIELIETKRPIKDADGNILYFRGTIKKVGVKNLSSLLGESDFAKRLAELKEKAKDIAFKFSLVKIKAPIARQQFVKDVFNVPPYLLNDATFLVVLENEANQRSLEKMLKYFPNMASVIRYPRDILNIDDLIPVLDLMLKAGVVFFTNEIYEKHIRALNFTKRLKKALDQELRIKARVYKSQTDTLLKIDPDLDGFKADDEIYDYLPLSLYSEFARKLMDAYLAQNLPDRVLIALDIETIRKFLNEQGGSKFPHVCFLMHEFTAGSSILLNRARDLKRSLAVDYRIIDAIDPNYYATKTIAGIYVASGANKPLLIKAIALAKAFQLFLISNQPLAETEIEIYVLQAEGAR